MSMKEITVKNRDIRIAISLIIACCAVVVLSVAECGRAVVMFDGIKRLVNISQEGEDDINDLRELNLISRLKLSTSKYNIIDAYRITKLGLDVLKNVKKENRKAVDKLVKCSKCGKQGEVLVEETSVKFQCKNCGETKNISLLGIEDVPYVCKGYILGNLL